MASRGEDISVYFSNKFTVMRPVRRVNVDLTQGMLRDLDERGARLTCLVSMPWNYPQTLERTSAGTIQHGRKE
jgi:hypothetical protein